MALLHLSGRYPYNGLGVLAFTAGFLLGPATGGAALSAGQGTGLFAALVLACAAAATAALRLSRHLPPAANQIPARAPTPSAKTHAGSDDPAQARHGAAPVPAAAP
jgi:hypothetical protein